MAACSTGWIRSASPRRCSSIPPTTSSPRDFTIFCYLARNRGNLAMSAPDLSLLTKRRFLPMFVVQFLGAFNDNLLKFAMLFLANFGIYAAEPEKAELLAAIATGLFILPYFLFSALAGQLADRID